MSSGDQQQASLIDVADGNTDLTSDEVTVIFVLGGPGVGKGTLCKALAHDYGLSHLCMGDLLREERERNPRSDFAKVITNCMEQGLLVPEKLSVDLLKGKMIEEVVHKGTKVFAIDGFPRNQRQLERFEDLVCKGKYMLFFDATEETMKARVLNRMKSSGRIDDTEKIFNLRYEGFEKDTRPVIQYILEKYSGNFTIQCEQPLEDAYKQLTQIIEEMGLKPVRGANDRYKV